MINQKEFDEIVQECMKRLSEELEPSWIGQTNIKETFGRGVMQEPMNELKICKDCKYFERTPVYFKCKKISGYHTGSECRSKEDMCGKDAQWSEIKEADKG